ncbi:tripartite tricarboxylate transporter substrate-binding protein [Nitratireductor sp. GCM10026969]|uniref:tripartite tricarboxylate transporter substrate-binding protein n=1 Tax=Nitratireductor sp. GCM10026969 TaxID=3252645 RepID=UPI00360AAEE1
MGRAGNYATATPTHTIRMRAPPPHRARAPQFKVLGQADFTADSFTPIAQINADPSAVHVAMNGELQTLGDIVARLKEDPVSLKISCGGTCSASWDIPFVSLLLAEGVDVSKLNLIPASGSAAGLQELAAGGVDIVLSSVPETDAMTEAGLVKTVAVLAEERLGKYPDVPTAEEKTGHDVSGGTWRGVAGPADMDPALVEEIEAAVKEAFESEAFQAGMSERGFGAVWLNSEDFGAFLDKHVQ